MAKQYVRKSLEETVVATPFGDLTLRRDNFELLLTLYYDRTTVLTIMRAALFDQRHSHQNEKEPEFAPRACRWLLDREASTRRDPECSMLDMVLYSRETGRSSKPRFESSYLQINAVRAFETQMQLTIPLSVLELSSRGIHTLSTVLSRGKQIKIERESQVESTAELTLVERLLRSVRFPIEDMGLFAIS